jgi:hypothetical protein
MTRAAWVMGAMAALGLVAAGLLYRDNQRLRERLAAVAPEEPAPAPAADGGDGSSAAGGEAAKPRKRRGLFGLGGSSASERPALPEAPEETRAERRRRRQEQMRAFLGRGEGESEEDYIARMKPLIEAGLAAPRQRLEEAFEEAMKTAGVSEAQRAELEVVVEDTFREAMALTNQAIAAGDLTPYEPNWSGALQFAGGLGAVLGAAEHRLGGILSPSQRQAMAESGFEWGEYLGAMAPWETLNPPPPPGGDEGG